MRIAAWMFLLVSVLAVPSWTRAEFVPSEYREATQAILAKQAEANAGKKFQVTDLFQFCGSDFCVQFLKTKIDTRQYYCFALGEVCLVRMYIRKDHPDAALLLKLKKGERITVYGTFDNMGTDFHFMVVDRIIRAGTG